MCCITLTSTPTAKAKKRRRGLHSATDVIDGIWQETQNNKMILCALCFSKQSEESEKGGRDRGSRRITQPSHVVAPSLTAQQQRKQHLKKCNGLSCVFVSGTFFLWRG